MAAPTSVRVEAIGEAAAILRFTYAGSNYISVYRSTDGVSYASITDFVAPAATSYTDETLDPATKYWYKLSDDLGSTFSSVVTVWSHGCITHGGSLDTFALPRFDGDEQQADDLNNMAERIESAMGSYVLSPEQCVACPEDGAVVIDCSNGCHDWVVVADQDINSISVQWCDGAPGSINFIVPPNTSGRQICGWPGGFGFTGDECAKAALSSGDSGFMMSVGMGGAGGSQAGPSGALSRRGYGPGSGRGGGGGSGCACVPSGNGDLTIKCCSTNCSMSCGSTKSIKLIACGGRGPYAWSRTGSVNLKGANQATAGATAAGTTITVTPPTNSGSGEAGIAYVKYGGQCQTNTGVPSTCPNFQLAVFAEERGCNDQVLSACGQVFTQLCPCSGNCVSSPVNVGGASCASVSPCADNGTCSSGTCDARSGAMIAAGCAPCGVAAANSTVSVTDAVGTVATITLQA